MMEIRAASENIVTPENDSKTSPVFGRSSTAKLLMETQLKSEFLLDATFKEEGVGCNLQDEEPATSKGDIKCTAENIVKRVVGDDLEGQVGCKEDKATCAGSGSDTKETPPVGRVKIKPLASLVETKLPHPKPGVHPPLASGFDNHIRSLVMNLHSQFAFSPLIQRPSDQFLYYDNSTNMSLKKMLNGNNMTQIPVSRPSFRPYVLINVPRPPRSQASMRTSFSTQTPPMLSESLDVPGTSMQTLNHLNYFPAVLKHLSGPNFTSSNNHSVPNIPMPQIMGNTDQKPNEVSTSNTDDLETSEDKGIIKTEVDLENGLNEELPDKFRPTEVDLEIELKEELPDNFIPTESDLEIELKEELPDKFRPTEVELENESNKESAAIGNAYYTFGTHFMDVPDAENCEVEPELPIPDPLLIMPGEAFLKPPSRAAKTKKTKPVYELPTYCTTGTFLCKCCDFRCDKIREMKEHSKEMHTAENNYKCLYCVKNLSPRLYHKTLLALEYHVAKVHRGQKMWQCKKCSKSYKCRAFYKDHVEKHCSNLRPYACHKCTFTCMTEAALEKHIKSHENNLEMKQCPFCNKSVKKLNLKQHVTLVHDPFEEKRFHCISCNHAVGTQTALEFHYRHTRHNKQFKCHHCNHIALGKPSIKHHIKLVHLKEGGEKFVCGVNGCGETTYSIANMTYHRKIHSTPDSELFMCPAPDCSKKFLSYPGMRSHTQKTKHFLPQKCSDCPARFHKESTLRNHIQKKHVTRKMKKMEKGGQEPKVKAPIVDTTRD